ncbi:MAG: hydrogenase maturation nickel metallochaperone HypA [Candidatus Acidulodesulfobacterium ferriphilum]|uniref:Hydrogenase maturation nickel metallochaperone HypA n=1 Tax=Candidatus Acidulodesulfobacterium ferriphilum TaxID=2597223 RepID=A0A519BBT0_9DELT|nr:MAG: hydrogenase maturation nickel metallochaperone HypA [Candidatus Acidulodesulfobacterium ferriphilum]
MHEFSIALEIVDTLQENGYLKGVKSVSEVKLNLGKYSGIDKNYLVFAFQNLNDERFKNVLLDFIPAGGDEITIQEILVD